MKKLSVVLATFNEEENIERCLKSVQGFADETIIVDGKSKDRTTEIAKNFGAIVISTTNKPNFHINKQKAIDAATGKWILQLDADEVVSEGLKKEIGKIIERNPEENGYWMPRKNYFLGRFLMKGGQYPDYTIRLYRNGKGKLPQKDVHEQAVVEGKVGYLKYGLLHYPYRDFKFYVEKWNRYNMLFAKQIEDEMRGRNIFYKLIHGFGYLVLRPAHWLLTTYIRHKGFYDSWQGFVFSAMSALRFPASYIMYLIKR